MPSPGGKTPPLSRSLLFSAVFRNVLFPLWLMILIPERRFSFVRRGMLRFQPKSSLIVKAGRRSFMKGGKDWRSRKTRRDDGRNEGRTSASFWRLLRRRAFHLQPEFRAPTTDDEDRGRLGKRSARAAENVIKSAFSASVAVSLLRRRKCILERALSVVSSQYAVKVPIPISSFARMRRANFEGSCWHGWRWCGFALSNEISMGGELNC